MNLDLYLGNSAVKRRIALLLLLLASISPGKSAVSQTDDVFALANTTGERYLETRGVLVETVADSTLEAHTEGAGIDAVYARVLVVLKNEPERYESMERTFNDFVALQRDTVNPFSTPHRYIPGLDDETAAAVLGERLLKTNAFHDPEDEYEIVLVKALAAEGLAGLDYPVSTTILIESLKSKQAAPVLEAIEESFGFLADSSVPGRIEKLIAGTRDEAMLGSLKRIKALALRVLEKQEDPTDQHVEP